MSPRDAPPSVLLSGGSVSRAFGEWKPPDEQSGGWGWGSGGSGGGGGIWSSLWGGIWGSGASADPTSPTGARGPSKATGKAAITVQRFTRRMQARSQLITMRKALEAEEEKSQRRRVEAERRGVLKKDYDRKKAERDAKERAEREQREKEMRDEQARISHAATYIQRHKLSYERAAAIHSLRGVVYKLSSGKLGGFKRRYFYVRNEPEGETLVYRGGDHDGTKTEADERSIPIASISSVHVVSASRFEIQIDTTVRREPYVIRCEHKKEMETWTASLHLLTTAIR